MARNVNTTITPTITLHVNIIKNDGSVVEKKINIEDMVTDLRYAANGKNNKVSGRVSDIGFSVARTKRLYTNVLKAKSWFKIDVTPTILSVDASKEYHSDVREIQIRELLEDQGMTDVKMINTYLSYGFHAEVLRSDDTVNIFDVREGDILTDIRYLLRGDEAVLPSAKLIAIKREGTTMKPISLVLNLDNKLRILNIQSIVSIGGAGQPIDEQKTIMGEIDSTSTEPQVLYVGAGAFADKIDVTNDVTIKGNKVGVWGTSKNRDRNTFADETIITGAITAGKGAKLEIDGCVLTDTAVITLLDGCDELILRNCIVSGLNGKSTKASFISGSFTEPAKVVIDHCYFGSNPSTVTSNIYDMFEMDFPLRSGTEISGNYFVKDVNTHNIINIYDVTDNAIIDITDNEFEYSGSAIRIGTKGDANCTFNINNIKYHSTDESGDGIWSGLMVIQPYQGETITMEHVKINLNNVKRKDTLQLYFMYAIIKDGYTVFTEENAPIVRVNGKEYPRLFNYVQEEGTDTPTPTPVDKTQLEKLFNDISSEMSTTSTVYTYSTIDALSKEATITSKLLNNPDATQEEIDAQIITLQTAYINLEVVNKESLIDFINEANSEITRNVYTIVSVDSLKKIISDAQAVSNNNDATQDEIGNAYLLLHEGIDNLKPIDKEALVFLIDIANSELNDTSIEYTEESKTTLQNAIANAQEVVNNTESTQEYRNQAYTFLLNAIDGLVVKEPDVPTPVDKEPLILLIAEAEGKLSQTNIVYTEESKSTLRDYITAAQAVVNDENATQDNVNNESILLQAAISGLMVKEPDPVIVVNKESLISLITEANAKLTQTEIEYTEPSKENLQTAITSAQEVVNNTDATQDNVDVQVTALRAAIDGLVVKENPNPDPVVDKDELTTLITTANSKLSQTEVEYTEESREALQTAINNAQSVAYNTEATQEEVDAQIAALQGAINGLVKVETPEPTPVVVNKELLVNLVNEANGKLAQTEITYTEESKATLSSVITASQEVVNNAEATQEEVNAQVGLLQTAIDGLVVKEPDPVPVVVNKEALSALITTANENLTQTDVEYTEASKEALQTAITNAQTVVDNTDASQDDVDAQVGLLQTAIDELQEVSTPVIVDKTSLSELISEANTKLIQTEITYTEESKNYLSSVLTEAQDLYDDAEATQEEVDAQEVSLQNAMDSLVLVESEPEPVVVNKASLINIITTASEMLSQTEVNYTEESKTTLNDAMIAAQAVIDDAEATQEEVDAQETAVQAAIDALVEVKEEGTPESIPSTVNKETLISMINSANEELTQTEIVYTEESKTSLQIAIDAAQSVLDNTNASQHDVDVQVIALQDAINNLVEVTDESNSETNPIDDVTE